MNKKICFILFICVIFSFNICFAIENLEYKNTETGYVAIIEDTAELLTDSERENLLSQIEILTEYGNIAFNTTEYNSFYSTSQYADNYYHSKFGTSSGTVFLIDMQERNIWIFSDGNNYSVIRKSYADAITDNVYRYATNKDYYKCAKEAFSQIEELLVKGKIYAPMKYINNGLIAFTVALFLSLLLVREKTKVKKIENKDIIKNMKHSFELSEVIFKKTYISKIYSPSSDSGGSSFGSSSSSGSSSGGSSSSSSSGSSGGGGGHRF